VEWLAGGGSTLVCTGRIFVAAVFANVACVIVIVCMLALGVGDSRGPIVWRGDGILYAAYAVTVCSTAASRVVSQAP